MGTEERLKSIIKIPIVTKKIQIGRHTINYAVAGSGSPILLIHGANFGWGVWYTNIGELSKYFTVYALDLPGAGRSSRINYAKMDPNKDLLQTVKLFIQYLNLQHLSLIGCSIGGWIALKLALERPEKINKIVVENSVGFADYIGTSDKIIGFYPLAKFIAKFLINAQNKNKVEKFLRTIFFNKKLPIPDEFFSYFFETMQTSHNLLFISRLTSLHKQLTLEKDLHSIKNKTLIVWGAKDNIIPLEKNSKNFHLISGSELAIIKDAGHIPSLEKPLEFNKSVVSFLQK